MSPPHKMRQQCLTVRWKRAQDETESSISAVACAVSSPFFLLPLFLTPKWSLFAPPVRLLPQLLGARGPGGDGANWRHQAARLLHPPAVWREGNVPNAAPLRPARCGPASLSHAEAGVAPRSETLRGHVWRSRDGSRAEVPQRRKWNQSVAV